MWHLFILIKPNWFGVLLGFCFKLIDTGATGGWLNFLNLKNSLSLKSLPSTLLHLSFTSHSRDDKVPLPYRLYEFWCHSKCHSFG